MTSTGPQVLQLADAATQLDADRVDSILFVDLDGTLVRTDLLLESLVSVLKRNPLVIFLVPLWLTRGRAHVKRQLAKRAAIKVNLLPFRSEVLSFVDAQRAAGRRIVLATAADKRLALQVADSLGRFDDVLASDGTVNLKGRHKYRAIRDYCARHGSVRFGYVGDATCDREIWAHADDAYRVGDTRTQPSTYHPIPGPAQPSMAASVLRALRPHQWVKNLLIFVPLITSHTILDYAALSSGVIAFLGFSACASAIYLLNDLADLDSDRAHPRKRFRPFAAGHLGIAYGFALIPALLLSAVILVTFLPTAVSMVLAAYVAANIAYSYWIKRQLIVDVVVLALMYTLRIIAGGLACSIEISEWLLAFSLFLFTSLAFAKRYAELTRLSAENADETHSGRAYLVRDTRLIEVMGSTCGLLSVLVLALYITGPTVRSLYEQPKLLWLLCPILLWWIARFWMIATRGELNEDPVVFACTDGPSWVAMVVIAAIVVSAAMMG